MNAKSGRLIFAALVLSPWCLSSTSFADTPKADPNAVAMAPMAVRTINPVYPYELLLKGRAGWAEINFTVEYSGRAIFANPLGSSDPAFAKALQAEIEGTEFMPPRRNGAPQLSTGQQRFSFNIDTGLDPISRHILEELRKPKPNFLTADQLDARPTAIRQEPPAYPYALRSDGVGGKAEIEVIIDQDGRPLFPRIISATHEDFGWAAASAIHRWRFQPPTKDGKKVEARMNITVTFDPAKLASSW